MAGNEKYNGVNCRLRTAFYNKDNHQIYLEVASGVKYMGKIGTQFIVINHLFRIDIEEDKKMNYTKSLKPIVEDYHKNKREYNHDNIKQLLSELGCDEEIQYCDYYTKREYTPHKHATNDYYMGNDRYIMADNKKPLNAKQLSIFDMEV